jgi:hypothetical protein
MNTVILEVSALGYRLYASEGGFPSTDFLNLVVNVRWRLLFTMFYRISNRECIFLLF